MKIILVRGIPGSGKSTYVQNLQKEHGEKNVLNCCADDFFTVNGEYKFDRSKIGEAHHYCFSLFHDACENAWTYVNSKYSLSKIVCVVSNTSTQLFELSPYIMTANHFNLPYEVVHLKCSAETSKKRNIHNVPSATIDRMLKHWQPLPRSMGVETIIETD